MEDNNNKIRKIIRKMIKEEFEQSSNDSHSKNAPILKFEEEKPWLVSIKIDNKSESRNFYYISDLIEKLIKERNSENLPVNISLFSSRKSDLSKGMEGLKDLLDEDYEVNYISYNPSNVEHTKIFTINFDLKKYSKEYEDVVKTAKLD